ncbi:hypothetical protein [Povalibacter sp.]|uniref:hypothetical protein n=1 Tax=Povalibacter sp. TaxID=1962978 RepID=UPI002F425A50
MRKSGRRTGWTAAFVFLVVCASATLVGAIENATFAVERVEGAGWIAEGVVVQLDLPARGAGASAAVSRLSLQSPQRTFSNVRIECPSVAISAETIACEHARITGVMGPLGAQTLTGQVAYSRSNGDLEARLAGVRLGAGRVSLRAALRESGWQIRADLDRVDIEPLLALATSFQIPLPNVTGAGFVTASLTASGKDDAIGQAAMTAKLIDITAANAEGSLAAEKFSVDMQAEVTQSRGDWHFNSRLRSDSGQAYAQPIFLDLGAHPIQATARGVWLRDGVLQVDHFSLDHREVAQGKGRARVNFDAEQPLQDLQLQLDGLRFPGAYAAYFQPLLLDTAFRSMTTAGALAGGISIVDGVPRRIDLRFDGLTLDDGARTVVLRDLSGDWHWLDATESTAADRDDDDDTDEPQTAAASHLRWSGGALLNLDLGASELKFRTEGRQVRLLEPARIPILDGALNLESFRVRNAGMPNIAFMVDAAIEPISVRLLCNAFGWPEFGGQISGKISKLRVRQNVATLGTTLQAQVFDGTVRISDLKLEQPFSKWPRFYSNIALQDLDLALVTGAFSFGGISGRLSGDIKGLELFNWSPVAFDASLYTPANDRSKHRISQRAVQDIGSIGGGGAGVTAALSSGVMRFFDDFNYDRLGFSCRLQNDVCHMDGVAPAPNGGYYLVKGKGLPRIDVIGGARRVDWPRLIQQLIAVTESQGPVVN